MTPEEKQTLIAQYAAGYDEVARSLEDFPADAMTKHLITGKWSAAEIVQHLADSEMRSAMRLRQLLAEENPTIQGYDEEAYAAHLHYNERDIAPALESIRSSRASTVQLLSFMNEEDWTREGTHTQSGRYTAEDWLKIYAAHAHSHAAQIQRLKESINEQ
ncbi:MAG: DinB family protein [Pyrinomonadaceae bacterium]